MQEEIYIEEAKEASKEIVDAVISLEKQLDSGFEAFSQEDLEQMISTSNVHLYLARLKEGGKIIGMATLISYRIPQNMRGYVEDVVVDESMRGKGVGKKLMNHIIEKARDLGVRYLNLTSRPSREAAQKLYESLGFEKRDTNVFRLPL